MAKGNRNQILNCRVTEETLNKIDCLRGFCFKDSRADVIEVVFRILSDDLDVYKLKKLLYYRRSFRYVIPHWFLSINER